MGTLGFAGQRHVEIVCRGNITSGGSNARPTYNVFHFRRTTATANIDKTAVETAFQAAIAVPLAACLNNRWTQGSNNVRCINDPTDPYLTVPRAVVGGVAGDGLSTILWVYILMRTTLRGGKFRGAKRIGPLSEADVTAGGDDILNAAAIARFTTLRTAILAGFTDGGGDVWKTCVVSRQGADFRASPAVFTATDITQVLTNKRLGRTKVRETVSLY